MTIPVISVDGIEIVELSSIPEPSRTEFEAFLRGRQAPVIAGYGPCAYYSDWLEWLRRTQ